MQRRLLHIMVFVWALAISTQAQRYEYWLDGDYDHRQVGTHAGGDISAAIDVSMLTPGLHFYNVRTQDGNGAWGSVNRFLFVVPGMAGETAAKCYERWIDEDYNGRTTHVYTGGDVMDSLDTSGLTPGLHYYNIRTCDKYGVWDAVHRYLFIVTDVVRLAQISYWIDDDTMGTMHKAVSGTSIELTVSIADLEAGLHVFNCQLQGSDGKLSQTYSYDFEIEQRTDTITHTPALAEYFFDQDPGYGQGLPLQQVGSDSLRFTLSVVGLKPGAHILYVRSADEEGKWSTTVSRPLYIRPAVSDDLVQLEYFFDKNDPGRGMATQVELPVDANNAFSFEVKLGGLAPGEHQLHLRAKGGNGVWSVIRTETFTLKTNTGITAAAADEAPSIFYSLQGNKGHNGKGIHIARYKNGTTRKVIIK